MHKLLFITTLALLLVVAGCSEQPSAQQESQESDEANKAEAQEQPEPEAQEEPAEEPAPEESESIILDKDFVRDETTAPIAVRIVVDTQGSCQLYYESEAVGDAENVDGRATLTEALRGRNVLDSWDVVCS